MTDPEYFHPCLIIPCYNHADTLVVSLHEISKLNLPCIVINDGSDSEHSGILKAIPAQFSFVTLIHHATNQGKGSAISTAIFQASRMGFTHALQIDSDGQHQIGDIPRFLEKAKTHPEALISGQPIYDDSVPKSRFYARYITHFWVWVETLSFTIKDSMCGFRVYPVAATEKLFKKTNIGKYMDFDTDIMVRLYWEGLSLYFIPTKVIYPEKGRSHFKAFKDNARISWMHTRLVAGMFTRIPFLLKRKKKEFAHEGDLHWTYNEERKGLWGIKLLLKIYRLLGYTTVKILLYPVIFYFWATGKAARKASRDFMSQLESYTQANNLPAPKYFSSFHHFLSFGESVLDKLASWMGDIKISDLYFPNEKEYLARANHPKGILIFASHLGNIEVCRALGEIETNVPINALVFTKNAARFNQIMQEINPQSNLHLIDVSTITPELIIELQEKLNQGEWVAITTDRTLDKTPTKDYHQARKQEPARIIWSPFLGKRAPFPQGSFIVASLLACPVYLMFGLKENKRYSVHFEKFADPLILPRKNRQAALQIAADNYAKRLEHYCLLAPTNWYNFYDFWQDNHQDKENNS